MRSRSAALVLLSLALPACGNGEIQQLETTSILDAVPRVSNSSKSPCWQQREIAKQTAFFASQKAKKPVSYAAPCDADKPASTPEQKVSQIERRIAAVGWP